MLLHTASPSLADSHALEHTQLTWESRKVKYLRHGMLRMVQCHGINQLPLLPSLDGWSLQFEDQWDSISSAKMTVAKGLQETNRLNASSTLLQELGSPTSSTTIKDSFRTQLCDSDLWWLRNIILWFRSVLVEEHNSVIQIFGGRGKTRLKTNNLTIYLK